MAMVDNLFAERVNIMNRSLVKNYRDFLRKKVLRDIADRVRPFNKSLVAKQELQSYLKALAKQYPGKGISEVTSRYSFKNICFLLEQLGGIHLRYNATVKGKTVNLNVWVMRDHELYLAMPRGELINEWKRAYSGKT
jgi:hypothetical protein